LPLAARIVALCLPIKRHGRERLIVSGSCLVYLFCPLPRHSRSSVAICRLCSLFTHRGTHTPCARRDGDTPRSSDDRNWLSSAQTAFGPLAHGLGISADLCRSFLGRPTSIPFGRGHSDAGGGCLHDCCPPKEPHILWKVQELHLRAPSRPDSSTHKMVIPMGYNSQVRRFRGSRKRVKHIHSTTRDKWLAVVIVILILLSTAAGAWLGVHFED
jgi:hypothetical protein